MIQIGVKAFKTIDVAFISLIANEKVLVRSEQTEKFTVIASIKPLC